MHSNGASGICGALPDKFLTWNKKGRDSPPSRSTVLDTAYCKISVKDLPDASPANSYRL